MSKTFDISDFIAQLEDEKAWRQREIRELEDIYRTHKEAYEQVDTDVQDESSDLASSQQVRRDICLKSLFVVLHAHLEGFFKTAIEFYALEVNNLQIPCRDANEFLGAATLHRIFMDMEQGASKDPLFKGREFPTDDLLHRAYRRAIVVRELNTLNAKAVNVPIEQLVGPKAKFTSDNAQRILHLVGFNHQAIKDRESTINKLASIRNRIAHGDKQGRRTEGFVVQYESVCAEVFEFMNELISLVANALQSEQYKASTRVIETSA